MLRKVMRFLLVSAAVLALILVSAVLVPSWIVNGYAKGRTYLTETVPQKQVAIVFGAGLTRSGQPSAVLRDRIQRGVELYNAGKVQFILMSGDNTTEFYDEPSAMKRYAVRLGVPEDAIIVDYAGRRTYDTCYRARHIFSVTEAIVVTQAYHLPRAVFTCNLLGTPAVGVAAYESRYWQGGLAFWTMREYPATMAAFWDIFWARPLPIMGDPMPISG
jgi:SanA protein